MREERIGPHRLILGDMREVLPTLAPGSVHACVTDPPYELNFMGKQWDGTGIAFQPDTWGSVLAALKPGAYLTAFAGSRTYHRITCAIEDAGFAVRDQLMFLHGTGFPKSHDVSKGIDRMLGYERDVVVDVRRAGISQRSRDGEMVGGVAIEDMKQVPITAPASWAAAQWAGYGSALKPAHEPICLARKPLSESSIAGNVLRHSTGALNIDGCRVGDGGDKGEWPITQRRHADVTYTLQPIATQQNVGRWPANVIHDGSLEVLECFPPSSRDAIRFFYTAKASAEEREMGLEHAPKTKRAGTYGDGIGMAPKVAGERPTERANIHPTVKPIDLCRWLVRLVTPPGGIVLDCFMGSGSTGLAAVQEGFRFIGVEQSPEYFEIALRRIEAVVKRAEQAPDLFTPKQMNLLETA